MEKEFVPYEQALALKELGFNESCFANWIERDSRDGGGIVLEMFGDEKTEYMMISEILAPIFPQAFRWFRENYDISSYVDYFENGEYDKIWYFIIKTKDRESQFDGSEKTEYIDEPYYTPEEAELECLKKLIEIVKNK